MTRVRRAARRTFRSMRARNFRLYLAGQVVSATGSWMQSVAQAWLVLRVTDSGLALGVTVALQFAPTLLGGAWAGVLVDRLDKRRLLLTTASVAGVLAVTLGTVAALGVTRAWMVYVLALLLGCVNAIDVPARRAFVPELVAPEEMTNAVSLNSAVFTVARVVGPAVAGFVIASLGVAWCFILNGMSFAAVVLALRAMRTSSLRAVPRVVPRSGQVREGLRYAWANTEVRLALVIIAVLGTLSFNYQVVLPLVTRDVFHAGAGTFGTLFALTGAGSLLGALFAAHHGRGSLRLMVGAAGALGVTTLLAALAPTLDIEMAVLVLVGLCGMLVVTMTTAVCQERTDPAMRGRVMALWTVGFMGSTLVGGPLVGAVCELLGARAGLALGGTAALVTALAASASLRRTAGEPEHAAPEAPAAEPAAA